MAPTADPALSVSGELTAVHAGTETRLRASGSSLLWHLGDARVAAAGLPATGRVGLAGLSRRLAAAGLTLRVVDRHGPIADLGAIRRSPLGWALVGSSRVRPRRPWRWPGLMFRRFG